jgi:hypothetical protein
LVLSRLQSDTTLSLAPDNLHRDWARGELVLVRYAILEEFDKLAGDHLCFGAFRQDVQKRQTRGERPLQKFNIRWVEKLAEHDFTPQRTQVRIIALTFGFATEYFWGSPPAEFGHQVAGELPISCRRSRCRMTLIKFGVVSCPVALDSSASSSERIAFNTLNRKSGNQVKLEFVDSETGDPVERGRPNRMRWPQLCRRATRP